MPDSQTPILSPRAAARPRCLKCQSRMEVQRITAARFGFEHWTLRCTRCGHIHDALVPTDPMSTNARGWLNGELNRPDKGASVMAHYRAYFIGRDGRFMKAVDLICDDDVELWQHDRRIEKFEGYSK